MYMDIANMTLEQLARITGLLSQARLNAYMEKVGNHTFLFAIPPEEYEAAMGLSPGFSEM
jgi:hypothetical protein